MSNFPSGLFGEAIDLAPVIVNQVEYHAFIGQEAVLAVCAERDVELTAYRPLGSGRVGEEPVIREIAETHGKSPAQVALRWLIEQPRGLGGAQVGQRRAPPREPRRVRLRADRG